MCKKKLKHKSKNDNKKYFSYIDSDPDLPPAPKLEIYQETFGGLKNITEKWYKENGK